MPQHYIAAFKVAICSRPKVVNGSRPAQNAAKNVAPTSVTVALVAVALVSIPRVLPIALVIALHKALAKSLR